MRSLKALEPDQHDISYSCPTHTVVRQNHPGKCRKCGAILEIESALESLAVEDDPVLSSLLRLQ